MAGENRTETEREIVRLLEILVASMPRPLDTEGYLQIIVTKLEEVNERLADISRLLAAR